MKFKKKFPLIVLGLLSIGAVFFSIIFVWTVFRGVSQPFAEHLGSTLELALPSSLALIVLIWFGAGFDYGISLIAKKSHRIWAAILIYLFLPGFCCIIFPALAILAISGVFTEGWNNTTGTGVGLLGTFTFIPAILGFFFIYIGAGASSFSRWLAGRIWREPEAKMMDGTENSSSGPTETGSDQGKE